MDFEQLQPGKQLQMEKASSGLPTGVQPRSWPKGLGNSLAHMVEGGSLGAATSSNLSKSYAFK